MDNKACFMFGHGICPDDILPKIEEAIERQYTQLGIHCFYVGHRGRFDSLAATAAKRAKKKYPDISLYLLLAYHPGQRPVELPDGFDGSYYPPLEHVPKPYAIVRGNRYMVDSADAVICYACHPGNARELLEYARRRQKTIDNLAQGHLMQRT